MKIIIKYFKAYLCLLFNYLRFVYFVESLIISLEIHNMRISLFYFEMMFSENNIPDVVNRLDQPKVGLKPTEFWECLVKS